jgi:hypothetical protein
VKLKQAGEEAEIARRLGSILYVPLDGAFRDRFALGEHQVSKSEDRKMGFQFNGSICEVRWKFWGEAGCDVAADGRL